MSPLPVGDGCLFQGAALSRVRRLYTPVPAPPRPWLTANDFGGIPYSGRATSGERIGWYSLGP